MTMTAMIPPSTPPTTAPAEEEGEVVEEGEVGEEEGEVVEEGEVGEEESCDDTAQFSPSYPSRHKQSFGFKQKPPTDAARIRCTAP